MGLLGDTWDFYRENRDFVDGAIRTHVKLSIVALALATATGVVLGIITAKIGRVAGFVVSAIGNVGRAVPTFAIMGIALTLSTIGFWPAVIGLYALAVPPIMLNTFTGVHEVDRSVIEAARGMGFRPWQVLARVELPNATPLIATAVRTAAVEVVATATLAGLVGARGLGEVILAGLNNGQDDVLLAGAIPVALLALAAQLLFGGLERLATPRGLRVTRALAITEGRRT
ncbi:MAG: ABC transporter permease [Thermoleophilia bacterium]